MTLVLGMGFLCPSLASFVPDKGKVMGRHSLEDDPNEDAIYWPEEDQDEEGN